MTRLFPSIMSLIDKVKTSYHFNPKLTSNLFLFLSDEICYYSFSNFMKNRKSDNFYICLYTQIMKFKYKFSLEGDYFKIFDETARLLWTFVFIIVFLILAIGAVHFMYTNSLEEFTQTVFKEKGKNYE